MKTAPKQYPDRTLENALNARGYDVRCHWQERGPKNTQVLWMEYLFVSDGKGNYGGMIVQTFDGGGWTVLVEPSKRNDTDATVAAVVATLEYAVETAETGERKPTPTLPEVDGPWEMSGPEDGDGDETVLVMFEGMETIRINDGDTEDRKEIGRKIASLLNEGRATLE